MQTADKKRVGDARHNTAEILTTDFMEPYAAAALPPDSALNGDTEIPRNNEKTLPCRLYRNTTEQKESFPPKDTSKEEPKAISHLYEDKKDGEKSSRPVGRKNGQDKKGGKSTETLKPLYSERKETDNKAYRSREKGNGQ
ncbi:hypothetical protein Bbelb_303570 [Branchiostoma belcheri]|nr:hypothetical protein Bbelb_303570 [Branchiostoma belcheri]